MWSLFEGTSGYKFTGWPPRGPPVRTNGVEDITEKQRVPAESKLDHLRQLMGQHKVGIYLVMEQDEHTSEYVADRDRRIRFVSGFQGSAGFVSIGQDWAELATDSRYYLIAEKQLSREWSLRKLGLPDVAPWEDAVVERATKSGVNVGVDPRLINNALATKIAAALHENGRELVPIYTNLVDLVWGADQPALPAVEIESLPPYLTGEPASSKVDFVRRTLADAGMKAIVLYALDEIAWLLNLRGGDVPYTPVFKAFVIITPDRVVLYTDRSKLKLNMDDHEGVHVSVRSYSRFFGDITSLPAATWVPGSGSWAIMQAVASKETKTSISPVNLRKAVKNGAEIAGAREAQLKCSISIVKYFAWLGRHIEDGLDEFQGGEKLLSIRETLPDFKGNSFETISAVGENAAAPHYAPEQGNCAPIVRDKIYLLDSGSQFYQGSTDITRTVHFGTPTEEERHMYTLVLKGQLNVSSLVFPEGTSGFKLDILARQFLWEEGLDYGHGTGHGIGSFLSIHELPLGIGMSAGPESILEPGHLVSDEPGYYAAGKFGVRLENDILVVEAHTKHNFNNKKFLKFEILTLVPYDRNLIDGALLTAKEKTTLNAYHARCREALIPYLDTAEEKSWLLEHTSEIA